MANTYKDGVFVWVLYSKKTGSILRVSKLNPSEKQILRPPLGYEWKNFITSKESLQKIYQYKVTKSGLEKRVHRFLITKG